MAFEALALKVESKPDVFDKPNLMGEGLAGAFGALGV